MENRPQPVTASASSTDGLKTNITVSHFTDTAHHIFTTHQGVPAFSSEKSIKVQSARLVVFFRIFLYFTFKKHYQILPRVLVDSIQVGRNTLWPQAADQGDSCFIKLRMFAPHEPGKAENDLKKHFNSFLFSIILGDTN